MTDASSGDADDREREVEDRLRDLHDHLAATEELAVDREANRWLGEAQAVAADLRAADLDAGRRRERLDHVRTLLENVGETDNDAADERVERALAVLRSLEGDAADR